MKGVVCIGNVVLDTLVRSVENLEWGKSRWVEAIEHGLGGNGGNTSYALARLGVPVRLVSFTGHDRAAAEVLRILESANVDTRHLQRMDAETPETVVLVNPQGARMLLHRPGVSIRAFGEPVIFTADLVEGIGFCHLSNIYSTVNLRRTAPEILRRARAAGLFVSVDTGWDSRGQWMEALAPCLEYTDLLFVNEDESRMLSGNSEPARAAAVFRARGARAVVVKLGPEGCRVFGQQVEFAAPAFPVHAVDTTGAGDCFAGGFLAGLAMGMEMPEAARLANAVGALSVRRLGAVSGLLPLKETLAWMEPSSP